MTQAAYKQRGPDAYFTAAKQATEETAAIYAQSFNPLERLVDQLRATARASIRSQWASA